MCLSCLTILRCCCVECVCVMVLVWLYGVIVCVHVTMHVHVNMDGCCWCGCNAICACMCKFNKSVVLVVCWLLHYCCVISVGWVVSVVACCYEYIYVHNSKTHHSVLLCVHVCVLWYVCQWC